MEGKEETLYNLVLKGLLSIRDAAAEAEQTEEQFKAGMDAWLAANEP